MSDKIRLIYNKIENRIDEICDDGFVLKENQQEYETLTDLEDFIDSLPEEPTSEEKSEKELAETYLAVFDKKYPILPTLKGKQKADFKNFLNKCQQEFGLKEFGIHPTQSKLFEKLTLLWAVWGAEHLEGLGKLNQDEFDKEPASEDLIEEIDKIWKTCNPIDEGMGVETANIHIEQFDDIARHFAEWQKKRDFPAKDITDSTMYWCGYKDCKEEIMKDAVEAEVMYPASSSTLQIRYKLPKNTKLKYGDKVKIIIVKNVSVAQ